MELFFQKDWYRLRWIKKYSFPVSEVYDWHISHLAKPYIKERGYFGNSLDELETAVLNGESIACVTLNKIEEDVLCFQIGTDWMDYYESGSYGLFIPLKEVEEYQKLKEDVRDWNDKKDTYLH